MQQQSYGSKTRRLCGTQLVWGGWERGLRVSSAALVLIHKEVLNTSVEVPPAFTVPLLLVLSCKVEEDQGDSAALPYYPCLQ